MLAAAGFAASSATPLIAAQETKPTFTSGGGTEPLGGHPPEGATPSVTDFDYQIKYQRAFEAVLWNMPAIAIYSFRRAAFDDLGLKDNDIIAYSSTATPRLEAITANSTTPYIAAYTDCARAQSCSKCPRLTHPGVSTVRLSTRGSSRLPMWVRRASIKDKAESSFGKLLFTPPGFKSAVPRGYLHVPSPNYRVAFAFRSVPAPGKGAAEAYLYAKKLRMYYLSEAGHPPDQRFVDPSDQRYPTLPLYDERHFEDMHAVMSVEPVREQDKVMMGMLMSLGIEKGKPFSPDEKTKRAMRQAAIDTWFYMQWWFDHFPNEKLYWPDRHYASLLQADENRKFTFTYEDRIDLINRAAEYFWCTYMPKVLSDHPQTQYLMAMADKNGDLLEAGKLYKLDVPAEMPVKQFWALTVYDRATMSFIYSDSGRTTLSSYDLPKMRRNADGGVTLYMGPSAPNGYESNWIPTSGKRPLPAMRCYGPTDALNNKSFKLDDVELV